MAENETKEIMDPVTDQGDGATGETVTNEQAQQLVDGGEAQPGEQLEEEKTAETV